MLKLAVWYIWYNCCMVYLVSDVLYFVVWYICCMIFYRMVYLPFDVFAVWYICRMMFLPYGIFADSLV